METTSTKSTQTVIWAVVGSIVSGMAIQFVILLIWSGGAVERLRSLEATMKDTREQLLKIEERGFRGTPLTDSQIKDVQDRLNRIVQALDSTYSLINEHMRSDHGRQQTERIDAMERHLRAIDLLLRQRTPQP